jgi:hypothetical protein
MSHIRHRIALALAPPLCVALALAFAGLPQAQAATLDRAAPFAPAAIVASGRYCYNWDFFNRTQQDANDLHFRIRGVSQVDVWYTGSANGFGQPDASSGYDAATDSYVVNFSNGIVPQGDKLHVGLCTNHPALEVYDANWTVDGAPVGPAPMYADLRFTSVSRTQVRIELTNPQSFSVTLVAFNVLDPIDGLLLDDLNGETAGQLSLVGEGVVTPEVLPPNGSRSFDVFFQSGPVTQAGDETFDVAHGAQEGVLDPDHPLVVEAVLAPEDDEANVLHLFAQTLPPPKLMLPIVLRR